VGGGLEPVVADDKILSASQKHPFWSYMKQDLHILKILQLNISSITFWVRSATPRSADSKNRAYRLVIGEQVSNQI
jgi:hypothetical protein